MADHNKSSKWLHALLTQTEDELLHMIKKDPELVELQLEFNCVLEVTGSKKKPCMCCIKFETLQWDSPLDQMISDFEGFLQAGHCSHLTSEFYHNDLEITASINIIHIAAAFGKMKILKAVFPKILKPYEKKNSTGVTALNLLHISILHQRFDVFSLAIKRGEYFQNFRRPYVGLIQDIGINYGYMISMAASFNGIEYIQLLYRNRKKICISSDEVSDGFRIALYNKSLECSEYLLHKLNAISHKYSQIRINGKILNSISDSKDMRLFNILLQVEYLDTAQCILHFIEIGEKHFVKKLLEKRHAKCKNHYERQYVPFLTQAVLQDCSSDMFQVILEYGQTDIHKCRDGYSGLDWACILENKEAEKQMRNYGMEEHPEMWKRVPPMFAVFDCYHPIIEGTDSYDPNYTGHGVKFDLFRMIQRLVGLGQNVNAETCNGLTPLITAVNMNNKHTFPLLRFLLLNGADPFKGCVNISKFMNNEIITEFLYCNVDMCRRNFESSILRHILVTKYSGVLVNLILKYSHTIPSHYKRALSHMHAFPEGVISTEELNTFDDLFNNPRPLLVLCRNFFRRFYGYKIHAFIKEQNLPSMIRKILTLEDELKEDGMLTALNQKMECLKL